MKLWCFTANSLQQSRRCGIGSHFVKNIDCKFINKDKMSDVDCSWCIKRFEFRQDENNNGVIDIFYE